MADNSNLKRQLQSMPDDVREALEQRGLIKAYDERPVYQRNDYLGWISRARRDATRSKRIEQMLEELATGGVYMNMRHSPSA
jgi:uncharacterized protein YdeI (YjbR/CyaY-like superfamily)